jgi:hypothetical protein
MNATWWNMKPEDINCFAVRLSEWSGMHAGQIQLWANTHGIDLNSIHVYKFARSIKVHKKVFENKSLTPKELKEFGKYESCLVIQKEGKLK